MTLVAQVSLCIQTVRVNQMSSSEPLLQTSLHLNEPKKHEAIWLWGFTQLSIDAGMSNDLIFILNTLFSPPTNTARTKWRQTNKTHRRAHTHTKKIKPPNCPRLANCRQCAGPGSGLVKTLCTNMFGVLWIWLERICIAACAASIENITTGVCEAARCRRQACQGRTRRLNSRIAGRRKTTNGHKRKKNKSI